MTSLLSSATLKSLISEENQLFFKQWLKCPSQLGTFTPTSTKLANLMANHLNITDKTIIVEIGAATGRVSRALLEKGANINRLAMIDPNKTLIDFLKSFLENIYNFKIQPHIIHGNAESLAEIIPASWIRKVDYVVSTIPLACMDEEARERIIQSALEIINPETGIILHASSVPTSPIKFMEGELVQRRVTSIWKNLPPSFIWQFSPKRYTHNFT